jgi:beta-RFAP synthase
MLDRPNTRLHVEQASPVTSGPSARAMIFAEQWLAHLEAARPMLRIEVTEMPGEHCGLGSGTQLAQATAAGVNCLLGLPPASVVEVAQVLDRGQRSLIGSLGFQYGGLIVDRPLTSLQEQDPSDDCLAAHVCLPDHWRAVLVHHPAGARTFGVRERALFDQLEKRSGSEALALESMIEGQIVPAAEAGDFTEFSKAVFEYGWLSGKYYHAIQGGAYNGPIITGIVERVRRLGIEGVGQSSWGPVVFAWCPDRDQAINVAARLQEMLDSSVAIEIAPVRNRPADVLLQTRTPY